MNSDSYRKKVEEAQLVSVLWVLLIHALKKRMSEPINGKEFEECQAEALALRRFSFDKAGIRWSLISGVLGAVAFRQGRLALRLRLWQRNQQPSHSTTTTHYTLEPLEAAKGPNPFRQSAGAGAQMSKPPRPHFLLRTLSFFGDIYVGGLVTYGVMNYYYLPQARKHVLSFLETVPLVAGRSPLSDAACEGIVLELQKHTAMVQRGVDHPSLKSFVTFASNCQRRRAYESYLRREQGIAADDTVMVPPPGVPNDFQGHETGDADGADYGQQQQFQNDEEFFTDDQDWAASYTDDQEVEAARRKK